MRRSLLRALLLSAVTMSAGVVAPGCSRPPESTSRPAEAPDAAPSSVSAQDDEAWARPDEPTTLEEAERLLSQAREELEAALGPSTFAAAEEAQAGGAPAPAAPPAPSDEARSDKAAPKASRAERKREAETLDSAPKKEAASDCTLACRAFRSLERAVEAVCRLDQSGERCARARRIAAEAESRVRTCSCRTP